MSTLNVNSIKDANGNNLSSLNGVTVTADNYIGMRNRIINGDCRIDQRNAGAAVTASGAYPVDRFTAINITDGSFSAQQDSSAPVGFVNSIKFTTTTADGTLTTTQNSNVRHLIEGTNIADLGWGTANAKTVTLSFWVRSSLTGTFGGALRNSASDRSYPFTYTISVADTWEYKTVTIAGDTSGTWLTTTGVGLRLSFSLGAGPDISGTAGAWSGSNLASATGAVSVIGTLNATWYITGVQLEVGSVATPFERRPYGTELSLCQRYFQAVKGSDAGYARIGYGPCQSATTGLAQYKPLVQFRANPTYSTSGNLAVYDGVTIIAVTGTSVDGATTPYMAVIGWTLASGGQSTRAYEFIINNDATGRFFFNAEL